MPLPSLLDPSVTYTLTLDAHEAAALRYLTDLWNASHPETPCTPEAFLQQRVAAALRQLQGTTSAALRAVELERWPLDPGLRQGAVQHTKAEAVLGWVSALPTPPDAAAPPGGH